VFEYLGIRFNGEEDLFEKQKLLLRWKNRNLAFKDKSNYAFIRTIYDWLGEPYRTEKNEQRTIEASKKKINNYPTIEIISEDDQVSIDNEQYDYDYEKIIQASPLSDTVMPYNFSEVKPKERELEEEGRTAQSPKYKRDPIVAEMAMAHAEYRCEINPKHETFIRKNSDVPYTESHHLIPMKYSEQFEYSLDTEVNIVSLCSNCHNKIHYGRGADELLKKLYHERKDYLEKAGIGLSEEDLLKLYGYE
jgi:hypothetical protein